MSGHHAWTDVKKDKPALLREIESLRAVLAPLLDEPYRHVPRHGEMERECLFCEWIPFDGAPGHFPDCVVLRADALLGR